jgi:ferredoxin--NADP+ reductase
VLAALAASAVRDVHILIRRGPAEVKFTPAELFQLSELSDTDVVVHDGETASATLRWWGTSASG